MPDASDDGEGDGEDEGEVEGEGDGDGEGEGDVPDEGEGDVQDEGEGEGHHEAEVPGDVHHEGEGEGPEGEIQHDGEDRVVEGDAAVSTLSISDDEEKDDEVIPASNEAVAGSPTPTLRSIQTSDFVDTELYSQEFLAEANRQDEKLMEKFKHGPLKALTLGEHAALQEKERKIDEAIDEELYASEYRKQKVQELQRELERKTPKDISEMTDKERAEAKIKEPLVPADSLPDLADGNALAPSPTGAGSSTDSVTPGIVENDIEKLRAKICQLKKLERAKILGFKKTGYPTCRHMKNTISSKRNNHTKWWN